MTSLDPANPTESSAGFPIIYGLSAIFEGTEFQVIDSHTGGEPTRVVVSGGPDLGRGDLATRRAIFRDHFDDFRSAVCNEPRGSDTMVGASSASRSTRRARRA